MTNANLLSSFINDAIRVLVIAQAAKDKKSFKLNDYRIMLCDYYLKFPLTMFGTEISQDAFKANFNEYYAFFHWRPNIAAYRKVLSYLLSKNLLSRTIAESNAITYSITENGIELLSSLENEHLSHLIELSEKMSVRVKKISSDSGIENDIESKVSVLSKKMEVAT